jgi:hypothetical protein
MELHLQYIWRWLHGLCRNWIAMYIEKTISTECNDNVSPIEVSQDVFPWTMQWNSSEFPASTVPTLPALLRHNTENSKQIFPEKELCCVLSPNFHIHVSVSDWYIPRICLPILLHENMWTDFGNICISRSQTHECGKWGWVQAIPFMGIHK